MITPLRLGFLLSGLLHVAIVAAFSVSWQQDIPAVDQARPLTLSLAVFQPAQAAPPPVPVQELPSAPEPQVAEEPPAPQPVEQQEETAPPVEPRSAPVAESTEPQPAEKRRKVVKRVEKPKPVKRKPIKARSLQPGKTESKPVKTAAVPNPPVIPANAEKPQPVAVSVGLQEKQHYLAALAAKINRSKYYPIGSRRRGEQGKVVVHFVVQKNGDLTGISIVESSGSKRLDAAALKTLKRVSPFRPIPDALNRDRWPISVPIAFSLSG